MSEYPWNEKNNTFAWLSSLYIPLNTLISKKKFSKRLTNRNVTKPKFLECVIHISCWRFDLFSKNINLHLCENFYSQILENGWLGTKKLIFGSFKFTFWQSVKKHWLMLSYFYSSYCMKINHSEKFLSNKNSFPSEKERNEDEKVKCHRFSDDFRGNISSLICSNSINTRSEIWRQSL